MLELSDSVNRKFIDSIELDDCWEIETDSGWSPISHVHKTIQYQEFILKTETGKELNCADDHIIFDDNMSQIFVKDCIPGLTKIYTRDGIEVVSDIISTDIYSNMYDVTVADENHRFWSGDILSHNSTILDAITFVLYGKPFRKINVFGLTNQLADFIQLLTKIVVEQFTVKNSVGIFLKEGFKSILNMRNAHVLLTLTSKKTVLGSDATIAVELTLHTPLLLREVRLLAQLVKGLSKHRFHVGRNVNVLDILVVSCLELFLVLSLNLGRCLLD